MTYSQLRAEILKYYPSEVFQQQRRLNLLVRRV